MNIAIGSLLFLATVAGMEGVAYAAHRWVMHGPGWFLHASHHRPRNGIWELNDLYAVIFAVPSFVLLLGGVQLGWWPGCTWIGAGIAAYGAIYFLFTTGWSTNGCQSASCRDPATSSALPSRIGCITRSKPRKTV